MHMHPSIIPAALFLALAPFAAHAHDDSADRPGVAMPEACEQAREAMKTPLSVKIRDDADNDSTKDIPEFTRLFNLEMREMSASTPEASSGDPDVDFVIRTIPHHQGLVEMSREYLDFGTHDKIRKSAELFIIAQTGQIVFLCDWLEKHGLD